MHFDTSFKICGLVHYAGVENEMVTKTHKYPEKVFKKVIVLLSLQDIFGNLNDAMLNRASTADTLAAVDIKVL